MQLQMNSFKWASFSVLKDSLIFPIPILRYRLILNQYYTMY